MRMGIDEALVRVAERTVQNTEDIRQKNVLRRNQVTDMYGVEFTRSGDANNPASFYISVTPDLVYLERFEFKLIIQPFMSSAGSMTGGTSLSVSEGAAGNTLKITSNGTYSLTGYDNVIVNIGGQDEVPVMSTTEGSGSSQFTVTPNPHSHSIVPGLSAVHTTASDFRVLVEGIDVTAYLMAQHGGEWINGEGVYPSLEINDDYDILEVAGDLIDEGREADAQKLIRPGYKPVQITSSMPFQATLVMYIKVSHLNR